VVGVEPTGARVWGCRRLVKAEQGQGCCALGIGRTGGAATWLRIYGRRSPCWRGFGGKGVFSPWGIPQASTRAQRLGVRANWVVRPSCPARAHAGVEKEKGEGVGDKGG
jgi:hypothetical protein